VVLRINICLVNFDQTEEQSEEEKKKFGNIIQNFRSIIFSKDLVFHYDHLYIFKEKNNHFGILYLDRTAADEES